MDYRVEVYDTEERRIAVYDDVPLLDATRQTPGQPDVIAGLLPASIASVSHGFRLRVIVNGQRFCDAFVKQVRPQWSDTRKLILDRYVPFHEVMEVEAERAAYDGDTTVSCGFVNRSIGAIVKSVINNALGPIHYSIAHNAYPDGAQREYQKFLARKKPVNELQIGGIASGQWVGANRIDLSGAYAKDGDTIAGVIVDGAAWPDVRLLMIDSEETFLNSHGQRWHRDTADWTDAQYDASGYKLKGDAAKTALQNLIDVKGIDFIELNPHRGASGEYDDRVDAYGRYIALIYGGGECFNAAQVERGHAIVYLWEDGKYHVPEMELKDYLSYAGVHTDSIEAASTALTALEVKGGVLEILTALAYAADGYVWSMDPDLTVSFRKAQRPDHVVFQDPRRMGLGLGSDSNVLANIVYFEGNPVTASLEKTYRRGASIDAYGVRIAQCQYFPISLAEDADKLMKGLLDDLAYPEPCGFVQFYQGDATISVGDLIEFRDGAIRRLEREIGGEWGNRFTGHLIGRVRQITHRFCGKQMTTTAWLTSPLRSIDNPLSFITRNQEPAKNLYQFRLDDTTVGLDMGYHLD